MAVSEHDPTVAIVTSSPATVQILDVVDEMETERPDELDGVSANAVEDQARLAGAANVIVWFAFTREIDWLVPARAPEEYVMLKLPGRPVMPSPVNVEVPLDAVAVIDAPFVPTTLPEERVAVTTLLAVETLLLPASRISRTG